MRHQILAVGEVLWDLLPAGKQLGGAPANFTYQCLSMGADARLVTRIGNDPLGHQVLNRFRVLDFPTETVQVDREFPTGMVDVSLDPDGQPQYHIREHVAWDRIEPDAPALALAASADALCFGSLSQRGEPSRSAIRKLVAASRAGALRLFDVNLRPPFVDRNVIADSLKVANALKLNVHELTELSAMFGLSGDVQESMTALADRFDLELVALTRGAHGGLLFAGGVWSDHPGLSVTVSDTIGAGDAFTAALVVGRLAGRSLDEINRHANDVAAFVCSRPGGTPALPASLKLSSSTPPEPCP